MVALKFVIILGSVREGRIGERIAKMFVNHSKKYADQGYTFELVDAQELDLPNVKIPYHHYPDPSKAPENLRKLHDKLNSADGFFLVSAEYNRLPCPGLLNVIDHFPPSDYCAKPFGIISYSMGPFGGSCAASALADCIGELSGFPVRCVVRVPVAHEAVDESGVTKNSHIISSMDKQIKQVAWFADACKAKRDKDGGLEIFDL